mgnify:CR=1 FL=1|jgi:hypothetical protein
MSAKVIRLEPRRLGKTLREQSLGDVRGCEDCIWYQYTQPIYRFDHGYRCVHPERGLSEDCPLS